MLKTLSTASIIALMSSGAFAATISTLADESVSISPFGLPNTAAYGQTFTLDAAATLNSLTFLINDGGSAISYDLHIAAWNGSMVSGASLFTSSGSTAGVADFAAVSSSLGDTLAAAGQYVAFFQATSTGSAQWRGTDSAGTYDGGEFVFQNNGGNVSQWTTVNWNAFGSRDLAFEIVTDSVAAVPLPASLPLLLAGFGGLAAMRRRKNA